MAMAAAEQEGIRGLVVPQANAECAQAARARGEMLLARGNEEEALELLEESFRLVPTDPELAQMIAEWTGAIQLWFQTNCPMPADPVNDPGTLMLDLTAMTTLTRQPMPMLRLRQLVLPLLYVTAREGAAIGGAILERFSSLATWSVPIILLAGIVMAFVLLPSFADLLTPYGRLVLAKIFGFAVLMGLAALNKWRFVPAIRAGASGSLPGLQRSMAVEWSVMVLVFFTTAVLTGFFSPGH